MSLNMFHLFPLLDQFFFISINLFFIDNIPLSFFFCPHARLLYFCCLDVFCLSLHPSNPPLYVLILSPCPLSQEEVGGFSAELEFAWSKVTKDPQTALTVVGVLEGPWCLFVCSISQHFTTVSCYEWAFSLSPSPSLFPFDFVLLDAITDFFPAQVQSLPP